MAALYVVAAWLIMQVADVLIGLAILPEWTGPLVFALLSIGFPIALVLSWFYEITPEGIALEKDVVPGESVTHVAGRRIDFIVIALLAAAVILFAYDKWWIGPPPEKSIAVLAFENMSGDPDQAYFSDGISEDLLNLLAQIPDVKVISRSSAFSFKGKEVDIPTIAAKLNVAHVLEGSVRRAGDRVRITAQLIEASSDSHVWSESFDREISDIFAVQDEIATAISNALKVKLDLDVNSGEFKQVAAIETGNTDAYDAYLKGRELFRKRDQKSVEDAIRHFERALRLDEKFAPAHAQLAIAQTIRGLYGAFSLAEAEQIVMPHLERAEELEPGLAETYGCRALLAQFAGDYEAAIEYTHRALAVNPSYADAINWQFIAQDRLGRYGEAEETLKRALVTDPLTITGRINYAELLNLLGRYQEAHEIADELIALDPAAGYSLHAETSTFWEGKTAEGLYWGLKDGRERGSYSGDVMMAFRDVDEFDEARRLGDEFVNTYTDLAAGLFDNAIESSQINLRIHSDKEAAIALAAYALYRARRFDEALPLYERLRDRAGEGKPLLRSRSLMRTMEMALVYRRSGDESSAQTITSIVRDDIASQRASRRTHHYLYWMDAYVAAMENDAERAITALRTATQEGMRGKLVFTDPIFDELAGDPRFVAAREEMNAILAAEHEKVLQLICFNNPVPDDWRPLPETCEGVVEQSTQ